MKKIFKFIPVALAALAMTSCSNDDFFGLANGEEDGVKLIANVPDEIGEDGITRAARAIDGSGFQWSVGDVLRVYDSKLQKFDIFEMKEGKTFFTLKGTTQFVKNTNEAGNIDYAKAVFVGNPAGEISYGGWKQEGTDGVLTALVNIPNTIVYKEVNSKYISALPMWGDVTSKVSTLSDETATYETSLAYLSGQAKVVFKNGGKNANLYARAQSVRFATTADAGKKNVLGGDITDAMIATDAQKAAIKTALVAAFREGGAGYSTLATIASSSQAIGNCLIANQDAPLSGWFEARLEDEGYIQNTTNSAVAQPEDRSFVQVNLAQANMNEYENVVFLPLAPQDYELLVIEYSEDGTTWKPLRAKFDYTVEYKGNGQFSNLWNEEQQTVTYSLSYEVTGLESTYEIGRYMSLYNSANGSVELDLEGNFATIDGKLPEMYTIYVPQLNHDMVVNIKKPTSAGTDFTISAKNLVIADAEGVANWDKTVTINFEGFKAEATNNIQIKTKRPIQITGDFTNVANGIVAANSSKLVLGTETKAFKAKVVNLAKGDGEDVVTAVEINDVTTPATKIETLTNTDGVGITINSGEVETLQLVKNAPQIITMNGGKISTAIAAPTADLTASFKVTVNSKGAAEIAKAVMKATGTGDAAKNLTYEFNATFDENTTTASALGTLVPASGSSVTGCIFTAAQLLKAQTVTSPTTITLQADITADASAYTSFASTSLSLNDATTIFDGNGHAIKNLKQPLFATLSANVKNLSLTGVEIEATTHNVGALAKVFDVKTDAKVENVVVSGTKIGAEYSESGKAQSVFNVGGLFGQVTNSAAKKLTIDNCAVKLDAIQGYYNLGGFIGNATDDNSNALSIEIVNNAAAKDMNKSNIAAFKKTFWANFLTDVNCGKVGYFIGGITNNSGKVKVTLGKSGQAFNTFFSAAATSFNTAVAQSSEASQGRLEFARNLGAAGTDKPFVGMTAIPGVGTNQYIGYSTGTMDDISVWGGTTHSYGSGTSATTKEWKVIVNWRAE